MVDRDVRALIAELERQGWRVSIRGSGHAMAFAPDGSTKVTLPGTPSTRDWLRRIEPHLRRGGYVRGGGRR